MTPSSLGSEALAALADFGHQAFREAIEQNNLEKLLEKAFLLKIVHGRYFFNMTF